jgi:hypothetical protein
MSHHVAAYWQNYLHVGIGGKKVVAAEHAQCHYWQRDVYCKRNSYLYVDIGGKKDMNPGEECDAPE